MTDDTRSKAIEALAEFMDAMVALRLVQDLDAHPEAKAALAAWLVPTAPWGPTELRRAFADLISHHLRHRGKDCAKATLVAVVALGTPTQPVVADKRERGTAGRMMVGSPEEAVENLRRRAATQPVVADTTEEELDRELAAQQAEDNRIDAWVDRNAPEDFR